MRGRGWCGRALPQSEGEARRLRPEPTPQGSGVSTGKTDTVTAVEDGSGCPRRTNLGTRKRDCRWYEGRMLRLGGWA